ncbi:hypothetical protein [Nonomuraea sp. NEAU-A123]|uniref:hypothetical protein n=1 Tax=Nonomuraea sp. NEAU-A123 TaxID=2839649 RepID=UPI001BE4106F|nr:hypothetical protein [Nonomuraea sp. NEAU-A123]MBT2233742.1 hypothetical protein [Nonomuraea sp. NEAU-A123]
MIIGKKMAILASAFAVAGIALTAPAQAASAAPKLPPAAIPPPKCIPQSQYNQPYEWEYQLTRTLGKGGHGVRTHVFAIYYAPADIFSLSTRVTCSVRF